METEFEEQASKLNQGLKSCQALVSSYRTLLSSDQTSKPRADEGLDVDRSNVSETE